MHSTGSRSFTQTMRRYVGHGAPRVKNLFKYFNSFMNAQQNDVEVLICDEAHRIRETSANRYTRASQRTGRMQVDELIAAARVPVFLLDEHQVVKPGEIGTVEAIKSHASSLGFRVHHVPLDEQFRCGGSRKYEKWVLRLLGLESGDREMWTGDDHYEITMAESHGNGEHPARQAWGRLFGADIRRILLAVERSPPRWQARQRRTCRRLGQALERKGRSAVGTATPQRVWSTVYGACTRTARVPLGQASWCGCSP